LLSQSAPRSGALLVRCTFLRKGSLVPYCFGRLWQGHLARGEVAVIAGVKAMNAYGASFGLKPVFAVTGRAGHRPRAGAQASFGFKFRVCRDGVPASR
jgi:hypothetical protein